MATLRYFTAGESHGPALLGILEGLPAGLVLEPGRVNEQLQRRQQGYGRGGRMDIERDEATFLSGLRFGQTTGGPLALMIHNRDWPNWKEQMDPLAPPPSSQPVTVPRPGHADLTGALKYGHSDLRDVIERASARETAIRVALGAVARQLLESLGVVLASHVCQIHQIQSKVDYSSLLAAPQEINARADASPLRCLSPEAEARMIATIDEAQETGNTVGGIFEVLAFFVPAGLGSYVQWDRRLDGQIAQAFLSIPGIKGVEIGLGFAASGLWGSEVQDEIFLEQGKGLHRSSNRVGGIETLRQEPHRLAAGRLHRPTNRAGGIEGGISNGEPILVRAAMKPISTLNRPLSSIDLQTWEPTRAHRERSDVCAVPAASVIGEALLALVLAAALLDKFGGDSMNELTKHLSCQQGLRESP